MRINLEQQEFVLIISAIENAQILGKDSVIVASTLTKLQEAFKKAIEKDEAEANK